MTTLEAINWTYEYIESIRKGELDVNTKRSIIADFNTQLDALFVRKRAETAGQPMGVRKRSNEYLRLSKGQHKL